MWLIPVIDLMDGQAVRAVRGDRQAYRPLVSALAEGHDPLDLARALCAHADARHLYIADLDALAGRPAQWAVVRRIVAALPEVELWLDAGFADAQALARAEAELGAVPAGWVPVLGTESLRSVEALRACRQRAPQAVLSLDRRDGRALDPAGLWNAPQHWPPRVIAMTLERVGADAGPDLATLSDLRQRAPQAQWVGAGSVRHAADLAAAKAAGAHAWLVASALHDARLPPMRQAMPAGGLERDCMAPPAS